MTSGLRVALIGGPMYDALYDALRDGLRDDIEVVVHADHLTLNSLVAEMLCRGERIDVLSTHGKYAPSQREWLYPLDDLLDPGTISELEPGAVALCRDQGQLLCAPRNVDVRVLWWRTDRMEAAPDSWDEMVGSEAVFGFTGRGSGLFGLFYELVVGIGGSLFDGTGLPSLDPDSARSAIETILGLAARCPGGPDGITSWHYDEADAALCGGLVDCAASWPGATSGLRSSAAGKYLRPAPYPSGPVSRVSYSGCHGWAIPRTCGDLDGAVALVERLCSVELHAVEASVGGIPARTDVLRSIHAVDQVDARRLEIIRHTIADHMITYPPLPAFPRLEERGAAAISAAILGTGTIDSAVSVITEALIEVSLRRVTP